jgi:hypothetical protein
MRKLKGGAALTRRTCLFDGITAILLVSWRLAKLAGRAGRQRNR